MPRAVLASLQKGTMFMMTDTRTYSSRKLKTLSRPNLLKFKVPFGECQESTSRSTHLSPAIILEPHLQLLV